MSIGVKIPKSELSKFRAFVEKAKKMKRSEVQRSIAAAGLVGESAAADAAPVGTPASTGIPGYIGGTLRQSIRYQPIDGGMGAKIFTNVEYAKYQNNGTAKIAGKHFMEKGFRAGRQRLMQGLK